MWSDVNTIKLQNKQLSLQTAKLSSDENSTLDGIKLEQVYNTGWYIKSLKIGVAQNICKVVIEARVNNQGKYGAIGCRIAGVIFYNLILRCGSIEQTPSKIIIQSLGGEFMERSLLTLYYLSSSNTRVDIYQGYNPPSHKFIYAPAITGEKPKDYEKRIVQEIKTRFFPTHEQLYQAILSRDLLKGRGKKPAPDGLLVSRKNRGLVIIEAKMHKPDFEEGTAQLIQYYAFAKNHPRFQNYIIKTCLVTADDEHTNGYKVWNDLMASSKDFHFFVNSSNVRY